MVCENTRSILNFADNGMPFQMGIRVRIGLLVVVIGIDNAVSKVEQRVWSALRRQAYQVGAY